MVAERVGAGLAPARLSMFESLYRRGGWRLWAKILALNLLLLFVPLTGALSLESYERYLLELQERSMVQQARLAAAALGGDETLDPDSARALLLRLGGHVEARLRIVDGEGSVVADSAAVSGEGAVEPVPEDAEAPLRGRPLYRLGMVVVELKRALLGPRTVPQASIDLDPGRLRTPEVEAALAGDYGAATRRSAGGQRSLTLYSALPIQGQDGVVGAVVASQSTVRILAALYDVRLDIFRIFLLSLAVAAALSVILAASLVRPLNRLREQARDLVDHRGRFTGEIEGLARRDEIGDLSRALETLTRRLKHHIDFVESFATDVAHELKNPLASVRNAGELLVDVDSEEERQQLLALIQREVDRMGRMISAVREISLIDAHLDREETETIDLNRAVADTVAGARVRHGREFELRGVDGESRWVQAPPERVSQVLENLLDNAASMTGSDGSVGVELSTADGAHKMTVWDEGPGIDEAHIDRVFDRFFSYRPNGLSSSRQGKGEHTGLGLSIVRTVVEGLGGQVTAANRPEGGAAITVQLPRV